MGTVHRLDGFLQDCLLPPGDRKPTWMQYCSILFASGFTLDKELSLLMGSHFSAEDFGPIEEINSGPLTSEGYLELASDKCKLSYSILN